MNKKEQAAFDSMKREVLVARAFCRTLPVAPDVAPPSPNNRNTYTCTTGYLAKKASFAKPYTEIGWSTSISHGRGKMEGRVSGSRNSIWLYSTPVLALRALRYETEERMARELADIDAAIEAAELAKELP